MAADSQTQSRNGRGKINGPRFDAIGLSEEQVEQFSLFNNAKGNDRRMVIEPAHPAKHPLEEDIERWDGLA